MSTSKIYIESTHYQHDLSLNTANPYCAIEENKKIKEASENEYFPSKNGKTRKNHCCETYFFKICKLI